MCQEASGHIQALDQTTQISLGQIMDVLATANQPTSMGPVPTHTIPATTTLMAMLIFKMTNKTDASFDLTLNLCLFDFNKILTSEI